MDVTLCDMDDCGEWAVVHFKIIDRDDDWLGMEGDLCGKHDFLGPIREQWERESESNESPGLQVAQ